LTAPARLAVVVVSYEAREALLASLRALRQHASLPLELVVVDNASADGSAQAVRDRYPEALVIANPDNAGFGRACNQGWRSTRAPLVLFLNPDAEVTPGAVVALADLLETRPAVAAAGPRTRSADGAIQVSTGPDLGWLAEARQRRLVRAVARRDPVALAEAEARYAVEHEPDWVSGSCLIARRSALEAVSGFDERFFLYEEDADLCRRLRAAGGRIVFTPSAEVRHRVGTSMSRAPERARLEYHRSHLLYYRKHNGPLARSALVTLLGARGVLGWTRAALARDPGRRREAGRLLALLLGRP
jgi:N-acetylglucosaminyl-diphospho-decaprenol L-rhamnosyltransferase